MKNIEEYGIRVPQILYPKNMDLSSWSVIACDQYTQDKDYWKKAEENARRKAEEDKKKADEAARKKAEEDRKKAEQTAKQKAEEEKALVAKKEAKEKALAERKAAAAIVEDKRKALAEAQKAYRDELSKFCDKYGAYHYTVKGGDDSIFDLFNRFFDDLWF